MIDEVDEIIECFYEVVEELLDDKKLNELEKQRIKEALETIYTDIIL